MAFARFIHGHLRSGVLLGAALVLMTLLAPPLHALGIGVSVSSVDDQGIEVVQTGEVETGTPGPDGYFHFGLADLPPHISSTGRWQFSDFSGTSSQAASLAHSFGMISLLPGKQSITLTLSIPTDALGVATTLTAGSAFGGVTDRNGDGGSVSTSGPGTAFYTSLIDGEDFMGLFFDSTSVSVASFLSDDLGVAEDFGMPSPSFPGPAVINSIGIRFSFDLTGSDEATGFGLFEVSSVPEPASGMLIGFALAVLAGRNLRAKTRLA